MTSSRDAPRLAKLEGFGWEGWRVCAPLEWMRVVRDGVNVDKIVKAVGFCLALHAHADGSNAHPGNDRLAWEANASKRKVVSCLSELEGLGLLHCVERGSAYGTSGKSNNYTLTVHDRLVAVTVTYEEWRRANGLEVKAGAVSRPASAQSEAAPRANDPWADPWSESKASGWLSTAIATVR